MITDDRDTINYTGIAAQQTAALAFLLQSFWQQR